MSEEKTEVALFQLPAEKTELEAAFTNDNFIDTLINSIREKASQAVGDLKTAKGRGVYISMAANVRSTKVAIDTAGKKLVEDMKKRPALVDASRKKVRDALDELAVEIRKPVTDYEAEQERITAEQQMLAWHEEALEMNLAFDKAASERFESDHEMALLMNKDFDREVTDKKAEAERQRIAHEEELKRQAAEQAKREMAEAAQREIDAAAAREREAILAKERAEQEKKDAAELAERNRIAAEQRAEADKKAAADKAEREKQEAIAEAQLKARQEADRIRLEAEQKENARLAEEKRIADDKAKREKDVEHRRAINRQSVAELVAAGLPEDCAQKCVAAIAKGEVKAIRITY